MTTKSTMQRGGRGWFWPAYVSAWMLLAGGAVSYLVLAAVRPDFAKGLLVATAAAPTPHTPPLDTRLADELKTMQARFAELDSELKSVKAALAEHGRQLAKVATAVERTAPGAPPPVVTGSIPQPTGDTQPPPTGQGRRRFPPLPVRAVRTPRKPKPKRTSRLDRPRAGGVTPRIINAGPPSDPPPPPTGDTQIPGTIQFGTPVVRPAPARSAITLARASSLDALRASWQQLADRHPALLGGLQPRYNREQDGAYRLLAGPFDDRVSADRLCTALRTSNIACGVAPFSGNVL